MEMPLLPPQRQTYVPVVRQNRSPSPASVASAGTGTSAGPPRGPLPRTPAPRTARRSGHPPVPQVGWGYTQIGSSERLPVQAPRWDAGRRHTAKVFGMASVVMGTGVGGAVYAFKG